MSLLVRRLNIFRMDGTGGGTRRGKPKDKDDSSDEDDGESRESSNYTLNMSKPEMSLPSSARTTPGTSKTSCGYQTPASKTSSSSMPSRASPLVSRHSAPARADGISSGNTTRRNSIPESIFNTSVGILGAIAKIPKRLAFPDDVESESSELLEPITAPSSWASAASKGQCNCLKKYENAFPKYKLVCRCNIKRLNQPSEEKLMKVTEADSNYSVRRIKCPSKLQQISGKDPDVNKAGGKGSCCDFGAVVKKKIKDENEPKPIEKDTSLRVPERKEVFSSDSGKRTPTLIPKPTLGAAERDKVKPLDLVPQPGTSRQGSEPKPIVKKDLPESKPSPKITVAKKESLDNLKIAKSPSEGKIVKKPAEPTKEPALHRVSSKTSWQQISKLEVITEEQQAEVDKVTDKSPEITVHKAPKTEPVKKKPSPQPSPKNIKPDTISIKSAPSTSSFVPGTKTPTQKKPEVLPKDSPLKKPSTTSVQSQKIKAAQEPAIPVGKESPKEVIKPKVSDQPSKQSPKVPDVVSGVVVKESGPSRKSSTGSIPSEAKKSVDKTASPVQYKKPTPGTSTESIPAKEPVRDDKTSPKPSKQDVEHKKIPEVTSAKDDAKPRDEKVRDVPEKEEPKPREKVEKQKPVEDDHKKVDKSKSITIREDKNKSKIYFVDDIASKERVEEKKQPKDDLLRKEEPPHKQEVDKKPEKPKEEPIPIQEIYVKKDKPKEDLFKKEDAPHKQEVVEKPKVEYPLDKKQTQEPQQMKEKPSTHREGEEKPIESTSAVKRSKEGLWAKIKSSSKQNIDDKPKVEKPVDEKQPKEPKRPKEKLWGKAKSSKQDVDDKPKVDTHTDKEKKEKIPKSRGKDEEKLVEPVDVKKQPSKVRWGKQKGPTIRDEPQVEEKKPPPEKNKNKAMTSITNMKNRSVMGIKNMLSGTKKSMPEQEPASKSAKQDKILGTATPKPTPEPKDELVAIYSRSHLDKRLTAKEKSSSYWKYAIFAEDSNLIEEIKAMIRGEKEECQAFYENKTVRKSFVEPLLSHTRLGETRSRSIREKISDWKENRSRNRLRPDSEGLGVSRSRSIRDKISDWKANRSRNRLRPDSEGLRLSRSRSIRDKISDWKANRSRNRLRHDSEDSSSSRHNKRSCSKGNAGKSVTEFFRSISRVTPIRMDIKDEDPKDKRRKRKKSDNETNENTDDTEDRDSGSSKRRHSKRGCSRTNTAEKSVTDFWRSISRITPISQDDHRRGRPTSSRRLIDNSNIFVAERVRPNAPIYMKSKKSHHTMMRVKTGYWIDEKGLFREIVEMANDNSRIIPPLSVKSSRWYRGSEHDLPGTSKDIE